ncbi:MAG TPA: LeuA family protein [Pyrinomonadaceae bacterium]|nr:LeuA family protein [Pyrinomonadaceae bacterium]
MPLGAFGIPPSALLLDSTLRDGEQSPGVALSPAEKAEYVSLAEVAGIRYIEIGFPHNPFDFEACLAAASASKHSRLVAMALTNEESIRKVLEVGAHEVLLIVPSSSSHLTALFNGSLDDLTAQLLESITYSDQCGLAVNVGLEDASQGDLDIISHLITAISSSGQRVDCITIADTRGQLLPTEVQDLVRKIRRMLQGLKCRIAFHAHNDLGLATANSLAALTLNPPLDCIHVTSCGFGERAGNASLEQIAVLLETKLKRTSPIDLGGLGTLTDFVQKAFLTPVHPHAPVIGSKVFLHESGIHQKGMLRQRSSFQFLDPNLLGVTVDLILGKHSGRRMRLAIAEEAGCSEEEVWELQKAIVGRDKLEVEAAFLLAIEALRTKAFIGLSQHDAVTFLRDRFRRKRS